MNKPHRVGTKNIPYRSEQETKRFNSFSDLISVLQWSSDFELSVPSLDVSASSLFRLS